MTDGWVAEVRRWHRSIAAADGADDTSDEAELADLGYEAADPRLQTRGWNEAADEPGADRR